MLGATTSMARFLHVCVLRSFKIFLFVLVFVFFSPFKTQAAILNLSPSSGSFSVGSTFDASLFLNTENQSVNAIQAKISFPPDKLQLVSPSTGKSIVSVWTAPPSFNNQTGEIVLQGGIPGGINVSNGLFTTLTFRVKSVGSALIKFIDNTRVLLNDGLGTDALRQTSNAIYNLVLPPPSGPIVVSETHPDQSRWYKNSTVILKWAPDTDAGGYSYVLNDQPVDVPDNISEGAATGVAYKNLADGVHYFHIKSLRSGTWGGVTNFAVSIDTSPPAAFAVEISPGKRTTDKKPILNFGTTDAFSGVDYFEYEIVPLTPKTGGPLPQELFIEGNGPQVLNFDIGEYDVIVRAYDKAGNFREETQRLDVVKPIFQIVTGEGIKIGEIVLIPWLWIWIIGGFLVLALVFGLWKIERWHRDIVLRKSGGVLPRDVASKLDELQKYRHRYGKIMVLFLILGSFFAIHSVGAQQIEIAPPFVSTVSRNISNQEIFYVGGKTDVQNANVIIYLQNLQTGETLSATVSSDKSGEWFYSHPTFLSTGNYLLWSQAKLGEEMSPPSPQIQLAVRQTAIQFGASRLSFETLYLLSTIFLLVIIFILAGFIISHFYRGRKRHKEFLAEVKKTEESIHRGFAVIKRDIEAELALVRKAKMSKELSGEEKIKEKQLLTDIKRIEDYIGKEIWDIEKLEGSSESH